MQIKTTLQEMKHKLKGGNIQRYVTEDKGPSLDAKEHIA